MLILRRCWIFILSTLFSLNSIAQGWNEQTGSLVGGPCEGCDAVFEYGNRKLNNVDTLPEFNSNGVKLKVTGTIYGSDGKTPAADVILYFYQTDQNGIYATKGGETGWAKRHGYLRGWVRTGSDGKYTIYTIKPGHIQVVPHQPIYIQQY